jgi:hypothetical protein
MVFRGIRRVQLVLQLRESYNRDIRRRRSVLANADKD